MVTEDKLIQVKNLKKYYNKGALKALDDVTVDVNRGDVMVVIGPSGSGKSTLLRSLNLLEVPTGGSIIFDGVDITKKKHTDETGKTVKINIDRSNPPAKRPAVSTAAKMPPPPPVRSSDTPPETPDRTPAGYPEHCRSG